MSSHVSYASPCEISQLYWNMLLFPQVVSRMFFSTCLATSTHALRLKSWQLLGDLCTCPRENRLRLWTTTSLGSPVTQHAISLRTWGIPRPAAYSVWPTQKVLHRRVRCKLVVGNGQNAYRSVFMLKVFLRINLKYFQILSWPSMFWTLR